MTARNALREPTVWIPTLAALLAVIGAVISSSLSFGRSVERIESLDRRLTSEIADRKSEIADLRQTIRADGAETRSAIAELGRRVDRSYGRTGMEGR
jgi:hypothetical protein